MRNELKYGLFRYMFFVISNIVCILAAYAICSWTYLVYWNRNPDAYGTAESNLIVAIMVVIDVFVAVVFNTLKRVLRRRKRYEVLECAKHVGISFALLSMVLFMLGEGTWFSRLTVMFAYGLDFILIGGTHTVLKWIMKRTYRKKEHQTALLMTTDRFVDEGLNELAKLNINVRFIYLLKNVNKDNIRDIPVVKTWEEAAAVICWKKLDKVYIYGLDHQMVPDYLTKACHEMRLDFNLVDFNYRVIDVTTIQNEDPKYGALSFLEGKRDIPFPIRRVYWITETEADLHRGFHAHKLNCQLLYCPYGKIDIILDDGLQKTTVTLDEPGKGLILMPGLWREMVWQQSGSVLCVLASEYYDAKEYIRNYDEFIAYSNHYRGSVGA